MLAADLVDNVEGVDEAEERLNTLLEDYSRLPHPRPRS